MREIRTTRTTQQRRGWGTRCTPYPSGLIVGVQFGREPVILGLSLAHMPGAHDLGVEGNTSTP